MSVHRLPVSAKGKKCPSCGRPVAADYRPFCSRRCADLDLSKWLNEDYRIAAVEDEEPGDDEFADAEMDRPGDRRERDA